MASVQEVYGSNYTQAIAQDKALHAVKLYATNIAHKQFQFRNDTPQMWQANNMKPEIIEALLQHVQSVNGQMRIVNIKKTSEDINMFPYLINGPVEYFVVFDTEHISKGKTQVYSLYITPMKMDAY